VIRLYRNDKGRDNGKMGIEENEQKDKTKPRKRRKSVQETMDNKRR
jgi:hypothetical protein